MDPVRNPNQTQNSNRQHQRFSWQVAPEAPLERRSQPQQSHHNASQNQPIIPINTNTETHHARVFSYAQTPAEHLAFQYIPSPSEPIPAVPQLSNSPQSATPIDPRPQSMFPVDLQTNSTLQPQQTVPHTSYPALCPAYEQKPPVSPLSPHHHTHTLSLSPVSPAFPVPPVVEPRRVYTSPIVQQTHSQHARNLSNLYPLNTNVSVPNMPRAQPMPASQTNDLPYTVLSAPASPSSIKKDPLDVQPPHSPNARTPHSYAHEAYSPHNVNYATQKNSGGIFSPDSAHGPNGLDFALHQPGQVAHPNMDLSPTGGKHPWSSSLCSLSSDCFTGLFCPCLLYGRTSYRLSQKSAKQDPTDLLSYRATNVHCMMMTLSCGFWWVYPLAQRTRVRHVYKLEGDIAGDCLRSVCCCCCTAVQNEREVKSREEVKRQLAGPAQGYKSVGQMKYAPQ